MISSCKKTEKKNNRKESSKSPFNAPSVQPSTGIKKVRHFIISVHDVAAYIVDFENRRVNIVCTTLYNTPPNKANEANSHLHYATQ